MQTEEVETLIEFLGREATVAVLIEHGEGVGHAQGVSSKEGLDSRGDGALVQHIQRGWRTASVHAHRPSQRSPGSPPSTSSI